MGKYTIKPKGQIELFEKGLAQMFRETDSGKNEHIGNYNLPLLPGGGMDVVVKWSDDKLSYLIDMEAKELNEVAEKMGFVDRQKGVPITTANKYNRLDAFFTNLELALWVDNGGVILDDDTPDGKFWLSVARANPKDFDIDNGEKNPLVASRQSFSVMTAEKTKQEYSKDNTETLRALKILLALDYKTKKDVARAFEITIGTDPEPALLDEVLSLKINQEKDLKSKDGMRNIEFFLSLTDMPKEELELRAKVQQALELNVLERGERNSIMYKDIKLGTTVANSATFLMRETSADIKADILEDIMAKMIAKPVKSTKKDEK